MTDGSALELLSGNFHDGEPVVHEKARSRFQISLERPEPHHPIIHKEKKWRLPEILENMDQENPRLIVSRWRGMESSEHSFEIVGNYHILAITLQPSKFCLRLGTRVFPSQDVAPGVIQITPPGLMARVVHSGPCDTLHLHIPNQLLMECYEWSHGKWPTDGIALRDPMPVRDAVLQRLGATLISLSEADDPGGSLSADFLSLAITTHILRQYGDIAPPTTRKTIPLPKWRLKRAIEFIETHLDSALALADVARVAGLSRMHFAAQFRAATGVRPHEYVLRRRIEKAQTMLATADLPIVEIALAVGFSSQAHFTVVFKRFSGLTPHRWRQSHHV
jgi:AraC-like DNA-binding protein